jgi:predicted phosphoribosyltransferase
MVCGSPGTNHSILVNDGMQWGVSAYSGVATSRKNWQDKIEIEMKLILIL